MFASQLNATAGNFLSTVGYRGVYFYDVLDLNNNRVVDPAEIAGMEPGNWYGFDIDNPGNVASPIHTVGDYSTPLTHELQFGVDREVASNFGLSATFTYRTFGGFNWRNNGLTGADFQQIGDLTGSHDAIGSFSVPIFGVIPERVPANRAATTFRTRDGYSQRYLGLELSATKRLSNRWMARLGFSTNDHREYFDDLTAMGDPTSSALNTAAALNAGIGPNKDGGLVVRATAGSGKSGIFQVLPQYQFIATGLYEAPMGIKLGVNMVSRQGFAMQYHRTNVATADFGPGDPITAVKPVLLVEPGDFRLPMATSFDARVGKEFAFNRVRFNIDLDLFNVFNSSTVLGRQYDLRSSAADSVLEIMNPRVLRLGARFNF
jgi:hypothetical protein